MFNLIAFASLIYFTILYGMDINTTGSSNSVDTNLKFNEEDFDNFMINATLIGIILGGIALAFASLMGLYKSLFPLDDISR